MKTLTQISLMLQKLNLKDLQILGRFSEKRQSFTIIFILLSVLTCFYLGTGLYQSRYSLFEDYEILNNTAKIKQLGLVTTYMDQLRFEVQGRFRPVYIAYRMGASALFGNNIQLHHLFLYFVFIFNTLFIFVWGRQFGFSPIVAFGQTLLVLVGFQSCISWRLASGENLGMLFLNMAILSFLKYLKCGKGLWLIITWTLILISVFCKEAFIFSYAMIPLLYLCKTGYKNPDRKLILLFAGTIATIGIYVLAVRLLLSNPEAMKYAGSAVSINDILKIQLGKIPGNNLSLKRVWQTFIFHGSCFQPYIMILTIGTIMIWVSKTHRKLLIITWAFAISILVLLKLLYLRIELYGIYMFPAIVVLAFVVIHITFLLNTYQWKLGVRIMALTIISVLFYQSIVACKFANNTAHENQAALAITDLLAAICPKDTIYVVADPLMHVEFIYAIKIRLSTLNCNPVFRYLPVEDGDTTEALRIMKFTDPSFIPFLREQFYKQFPNEETDRKPETGLAGNTWIIMRRPGRISPHFKEVEQNSYTQTVYDAPGYYNISVLRPASKLRLH